MLLHEDEFVVHATMAIKTMFGALKDNPDYTSIINDRHFGRLRSWIEEARQKGAKVIELNPAAEDLSDPTLRRIAPTLILDATEEMTVLKEEIFGPILPVLTYDSIDDAIAYVRNHPPGGLGAPSRAVQPLDCAGWRGLWQSVVVTIMSIIALRAYL